MPVPQITYPLDLSGTSVNNMVVGEPHTLPTGLQKRAFVANHGPFFTKGLVVRDASNGEELTPITQYVATQLFAEASLRTGQQICSVIVVTDPSVSSDVLIDYQVLGGEFSSSVYAIQQLIDSLNLDDRPVYWGDILGKPEQFPPTPHLHDLGDLYGFEFLVAALDGVRRAILLGDEAAHAAIYQYIDLRDGHLLGLITGLSDLLDDHIHDYDNPHNTTKAHVGLNLVENYPVASLLEAQQGTRNDRYMTPALVRAAILALADTDFSAHIQNMNNPHGTNKAHVGLSLVHNFDIATVQQAIAGTRNDLYLTPYLMRQAWLAWGGGQGGGGDPGDPEPPPGANALPAASFTYSGNTSAPSGSNPTWTLQFSDTSVAGTDETATLAPINNWAWEFGDGGTSSQQNPSHTYAAGRLGVNNIKLTVRDTLNRTSVKTINVTLTQQVTLTPPTVANFLVKRSYINPMTNVASNMTIVGVNATSGTIYALAGGPWEVTLERSGNGTLGTGYVTANSYWFWDFSPGTSLVNGSNVSTLPRPINSSNPTNKITFNTTGPKTIVFGVHIEGGTNPGESTREKTVNCQVAVPPIPDASVLGPRTVLSGQNFYLTVYPFQEDATLNGGTVWSTMGTLPLGSYNLTSLDDGNFVSEYLKGTPDEVLRGSSVTEDASWEGFPFYSVKYQTPGNKTIRLTVYDTWGFYAQKDLTFTLSRSSATPPTANFSFSGQTNVVVGTNPTISFTNTTLTGSNAIASYTWQFFAMNGGSLGTFSGPNPPPKTFVIAEGNSNARVVLTVIDSTGLSSTKETIIYFVKTASAGPTANFSTSGATTVTQGTNHVITVSNSTTQGTYPIVSWLWDWGDSTTSTQQNPGSHTYTTSVGSIVRTITLTATDSNGNSSVKTVNLTLVKNPAVAPVADFTVATDITNVSYNGTQVRVTLNNTKGTGTINSWLWDWGDGQTSTSATPGGHTYAMTIGQTATFTITETIGDTMGLSHSRTRSITLTRTS